MLKLLQGIKVLDLSRLLPGPLCSYYLAELGAEVIKIEPPEGDYARFFPPLKKDTSYAFLQLNHNKKIVTLDLKKNSDYETFISMVVDSDVVLESFRPGVVNNLKIDFDQLKKINPKLVYCSITGYGQDGPYKNHPGHDINYLGYAGILDQIGNSGSAPVLTNFQIADVAGGSLHACVAIMAALVSAQKKQQAHYLDVSMLDCVIALNQMALATFQGKMKDVPRGCDMLSGGLPFYSLYQTKDGRFMALGALEEKFWLKFCMAIGKKEWGVWHRESRQKYPEIAQALSQLFISKNMHEWVSLLENQECCCTPILRISETLLDPQIKARAIFVSKSRPEEGEFIACPFPVKIKSS